MRDAMTERFENLFARLAQRREGAFVPFVNLCDPDPGTSLAVLETLVASGADALELGIPFSDPCADGPVVEASADRALANGATPARCLDVLRRFRTAHPETPVCLMLYINLVATPGVRRFMQAAADAGAAGVIVGSALVKIVSEHLGDRDAMLKALGSAAAPFKATTRTA